MIRAGPKQINVPIGIEQMLKNLSIRCYKYSRLLGLMQLLIAAVGSQGQMVQFQKEFRRFSLANGTTIQIGEEQERVPANRTYRTFVRTLSAKVMH